MVNMHGTDILSLDSLPFNSFCINFVYSSTDYGNNNTLVESAALKVSYQFNTECKLVNFAL